MSKKNNANKNSATDEQLEKASGGTYTVRKQKNGKYGIWDEYLESFYQVNVDTEEEAWDIADNLNIEAENGGGWSY